MNPRLMEACAEAVCARPARRPSLERMTPEPMLADSRLAPSSNATSRTSIRTTASKSWLNPRLMEACAEAVSARPARRNLSMIDREDENFTVVDSKSDGYQVQRLQLRRNRASLAIFLGKKSLLPGGDRAGEAQVLCARHVSVSLRRRPAYRPPRGLRRHGHRRPL